MNINEITRAQIEDEENYRKLQEIGRAYREDGHKLVLSAKESELKKRLLVIFDETQKTADEVTQADEEITELGEDESKAIDEAVEELVAEVEEETEPTPTGDLYKSDRAYADWESGWSFDPRYDTAKALPEKLTAGLKNAIKTKRIYLHKK